MSTRACWLIAVRVLPLECDRELARDAFDYDAV